MYSRKDKKRLVTRVEKPQHEKRRRAKRKREMIKMQEQQEENHERESDNTMKGIKITKSQQALITPAQPQGSTSKLRSEISGSNSLIEPKILQIPGPGSTGNLTFQTGKG